MLFSFDETFKKKKKKQALLPDIGFSMPNDIVLLQGKKKGQKEEYSSEGYESCVTGWFALFEI